MKIFFDGGCHVCSWEVGHYLKLDAGKRLETIDILSPDFKASDYGLDSDHIRKVFHVMKDNGEIVAGVPAFVEIWKALPGKKFSAMAKIAELPGVRSAMKLGYIAFAKIRPLLPRKVASQCEFPPSGTSH